MEPRLRQLERLNKIGSLAAAFALLSGFVLATTVYKNGLKVTGSFPASATVAQFGSTLPTYAIANWPNFGWNTYFNGSGWVAGTTGFAGHVQLRQDNGSMEFSTSAGSITAGSTISDTVQLELATNGGGVRFQNVTGSKFVKAIGKATCVLDGVSPVSSCTATVPSGAICKSTDFSGVNRNTGVTISGTTATATSSAFNTETVSLLCYQF